MFHELGEEIGWEILEMRQLLRFLKVFLKKKREKIWWIQNKVVILHLKTEGYLIFRLFSDILIGIWCNGNTADSGPAFPGSSPG
ncbi:MAG: hypothetical protein K5675_11315, partial [Lachnospiraceae bacterium]|nr:hypothetical protein [Lachnospiraceae bacterium]